MNEAVLVVMAAGMGSRFGGLKQIEPISKDGKIIMDYSIIDAVEAGFKKVIFIIKEELLENFKSAVGDRVSKFIEVEYAFQGLDKLPNGYKLEGREKPLGTAHAVYSAKDLIKTSFAVINADDFYGKTAFKQIYNFLVNNNDKSKFCMVGYRTRNTLTENGTVSRGVCKIDETNTLTEIIERTQIKEIDGKIKYFENEKWNDISDETFVSMNMWGFTPYFLEELESQMVDFLENSLPKNKEKAEFYLPFAVSELIKNKKASVELLKTEEKWYGITYKEDKENVVSAIETMHENGIY